MGIGWRIHLLLWLFFFLIVLGGFSNVVSAQSGGEAGYDYLLLAANRTSTMQREMQETAGEGYRFAGVMGGDTSFGGSEVVVVMKRLSELAAYEYRLLATNKTSTMQREMQESGDAGFIYRGQTVFKSTFGGDEAVVILERALDAVSGEPFEYLLLATKRTSTMQNELREAGTAGFDFVGLTVHSTSFGGDEVVAILKRPVAAN